MQKILKNYKTSFPAFLGIVSIGIYWYGWITTEQFTVGIAALSAWGLFGAKDYDNNAR